MSELTVACVWVRGHVPFSLAYVTRLQSMVRRHLGRRHRFVCLSDRPAGTFPRDIERIKVSRPVGFKGWWSKVELFNCKRGLTGRVLYLDLDTLVVSALEPIVDFASRFALVPDGAPDFHGHGQWVVVKGCNSSVMVWDAGTQDHIYDTWTPEVTKRLWGDQDWIATCCAGAYQTMPLEWFPRLSAIAPPLPEATKVILVKKPKNHIAVSTMPWVRELWC